MKKLLSLLICLALLLSPALAENDIEDLPDAEARAVILEAMEVYAWFVLYPLDVNTEAPGTGDGLYPVFDDTLAHPQDMQAKLDEYFSDEISRSLWSWNTYQVVNGWLYGLPPASSPLTRPIDPNISDVTYTLSEETVNKRVYTATVYYLTTEAPVKYQFVRVLQDGRWIFTEFPFFW